MKFVALAAAIAVVASVAGQASAEESHHGKPHKQICHVERHKVKVHGKWMIKETRFCK